MSVFVNNAPKPRISHFFGIQKEIYHALENSPSLHQYATVQELLFELRLRENIIKAARMLYESQVQFAPFRTSKFNPLIWKKTNNGYLLNPMFYLLKQLMMYLLIVESMHLNVLLRS